MRSIVSLSTENLLTEHAGGCGVLVRYQTYSRTRQKKRLVFYVLLTLHLCIISQINPTRCTVLFNIFISLLFSTCFGRPCAHHQEKFAVSMQHWYLSLCVVGVWSAGWIEIQPADPTPPIQSDKYQCRIDTAIFSC